MYRIALLITLILYVWMPVWQVSGAQDLPHRTDIRILIISDFNSSYGSTDYPWHVDSVIARAPGWEADLVLTAGDMIAGQRTTLTDENVQKMWDVFDERILTPLTRNGIPFGFTLGNHDASASPSFGRDRRFARDFWLDADRDPLLNFHDRSRYPFYFSFTHEELFIVSWYASSAEIGDDQREWLQEQLTSEAATGASYRILLGHLPIHAVAEGRNSRGENLGDTGALMQLIGDLGIDLYICGHHHAFYPARKNGIRFIHAGAIGDGPRPLVGSTLPPRKAFTILDFEQSPIQDPIENTTEYGVDCASGYEKGSSYLNIRRTSFDPGDWSEISEAELPRYIRGINGFVIRDGLVPDSVYSGAFSPLNSANLLPQGLSGKAEYRAEFRGDTLRIRVRSDDDDRKNGSASGSGSGSGSESGYEPGSESGTELVSGSGTETESESGTESRSEPGGESGSEPGSDMGSVPDSVQQSGAAGIAVSLRMGTPAEKGEVLARTALRNIKQNPVDAELTFKPDIRETEALAAGMLFLAIETEEFPDGAARVHLNPTNGAPWLQSGCFDGLSKTLMQPGTAKSIHLEWNRAHLLTAEPVFYSVDVSAEPDFGSLARRIPAGTELQYTLNEKTLNELTNGTGLRPDQLMFRITATDGAAHCSSSPFHIQNVNE